MIANMNNIGTMFGYLYRHTEQERFKINKYGFRYWNDKCFSIDMSKDHDYPIIFLKRTCLLERSKVINIFAISLTIDPFQTAGKSNSFKKISHMVYTVWPLFITVLPIFRFLPEIRLFEFFRKKNPAENARIRRPVLWRENPAVV